MGTMSRLGVLASIVLWITLTPAVGQAQEGPAERGLTASTLSVYTPPACVPGVPFSDITCTTGFDPWIEQFGLDGITAGCGGGKYCPGTPVTRDQMAVFIEKSMRGTANWPPHTVLVFHHPAAEANSNVNSGTELLTMVAAIPSTGAEAPSASNPWLIEVGPGIFDIGATELSLAAYVNIEGSGADATIVQGASGIPVVACVGPNELRSLSVMNQTTAGGEALLFDGPVDLVYVKVSIAGAGSSDNIAIYASTSGSSTFTDVDAKATGGSNAYALYNTSGTVEVRGGTFAAGPSTGVGIGVIVYAGSVAVHHAIVTGNPPASRQSGTLAIAGSQLGGGSVFGAVTCAGVYNAAFTFYASTCP